MNLNRILPMLTCVIGGILSVLILFPLSSSINRQRNGFIRLLPPHRLDYLHDVKLNLPGYYIAGIRSTEIFLGLQGDPTRYFTVDTAFSDLREHPLLRDTISGSTSASINLAIDSPFISVTEGTTPLYWSATFGDPVLKRVTVDSIHFLKALRIADSNWILRTYDKAARQVILRKNRDAPSAGHPKYYLAQQGDGIFSTDGMLEYDREKQLLFYIYYYRNRFDCLDTNLTLKYIGKTIDTTSHPAFTILYNHDKRLSSISGNTTIVNKVSSVSDGTLCIQSGLLANNENRYLFDNASIIDCYSVADGNYISSFYVPNFQNERLKNFIVRKNRLLALYENYLVIYRLND